MAATPTSGQPFTYAAMRRDLRVLKAVEESLLAEQGYICAYTGHRLRENNFHIEHLLPQNPPTGTAFPRGHDTDYHNMVACWPGPNRPAPAQYGAVAKDCWPTPKEELDFLSPLAPRADSAYKFSRTGEISVANPNDDAAEKTLKKLNLNNKELIDMRRQAIIGALAPRSRPITRAQAAKLLREMDKDEGTLKEGGDAQLRAFCFAIKPHLRKQAA